MIELVDKDFTTIIIIVFHMFKKLEKRINVKQRHGRYKAGQIDSYI